MTKKARILELLAKGHTTREVADIVGCRPEYVRVAGRQRGASGLGPADIKYMPRQLERQSWRWRNDPKWRARHCEHVRAWKEANPDKVRAYAAVGAARRRVRKASQEART